MSSLRITREKETFKADKEEELIEKIVVFLNANGFNAWRQANTGRLNHAALMSNMKKVVQRVIEISKAGQADKIRMADIDTNINNALSGSWVKIKHSRKGVSDIIGFDKRTAVWIAVEVKIGTDRLSDEQTEFLSQIKTAGGLAFVARDLKEFSDTFYRCVSRSKNEHTF